MAVARNDSGTTRSRSTTSTGVGEPHRRQTAPRALGQAVPAEEQRRANNGSKTSTDVDMRVLSEKPGDPKGPETGGGGEAPARGGRPEPGPTREREPARVVPDGPTLRRATRRSNLSANCMILRVAGARGSPEVRAVQRRDRRVEVHVVDHVEDFPPELQRLRPAQLEGAGDRQSFWRCRVDDRERRQRAVGAGRGRRERGADSGSWSARRRRRRDRRGSARRAGRPCRSGRCPTPVVTVERLPDCHRTIGENCQSLKIAPSAPLSNSGVATTSRQVDDVPAIRRAVRSSRGPGWSDSTIVGPVISVVAGSLMHFDSV